MPTPTPNNGAARQTTAPTVTRAERDRFVAFAFAAADVLIELDRESTITFASGALSKIADGDSLVGAKLDGMIVDGDAAFIAEVVRRVVMGGKTDPVTVRLKGRAGADIAAVIGCCRVPTFPESVFLTATFISPSQPVANDVLPDRAGYERVAQAKLHHAITMGQTVSMTYLMLEGLTAYRESVDPKTADALLESITGYMRAVSLGGDGVGQVGADRFAVMHGRDVKGAAIEARVADIARETAGDAVQVVSESVDLSPDMLSESDVVRALLYSLRQYESGEDGELSFASVMNAARNTMKKAMPRMAEVRAVIKARAIDLVFQPIVDLQTGRLHHFEALSRVDGFPSIQDFVGFAEDTGLIEEFDLAVLDLTLAEMMRQAETGFRPHVAVNLSARSVQSDDFLGRLNGVVRRYRTLVSNVLFELTETVAIRDFAAANRRVQELRQHGNKVCLDDVGAGSTSFKSLQSIDVDYAKVDGSLIKGSRRNAQTRRLLQSVLEYCGDAKIDVIAEFIETDEDEALVKNQGVRFGQGLRYGAARSDWREAYEVLMP